MLSGTCAFCGNQTHFTAQAGRVASEQLQSGAYRYELEIAATCDACNRFNTAKGISRDSNRTLRYGAIMGADSARAEGEAMTVESWSPPPMSPVDTAFIPEGVAGYYKEAHDALSISAYRGVLLLVRSVIEATAKQHGVIDGNLISKINTLHRDGHIRKGTKDMAHALRILGNDMAHGDIGEVPTQEDAKDALTIAKFVLDDVYVADALRADMMARRTPPEPAASE